MKCTTLKGLYHGNDVDFEGEPKLDAAGTLKRFGITFSVGWDIPTLWAIDYDNQCWANNAHGGNLERVDATRLFAELLDDEAELAEARRLLGLKPQAPKWMASALAAGWVPPTGFDRDSYTW